MTRLPKLDPAVAETRAAVRSALKSALASLAGESRGTEDRPLVLVALSGGADSLALAAAAVFEAPRAGMRSGAVIVDHGLQEGSAGVARRAAEQARRLGLDPVLVRRVVVAGDSPPVARSTDAVQRTTGEESSGRAGSRANPGPEAAAREARYGALEAAIAETGAIWLLTGHTRDDQAEQVLLALARGSGSRALAGIPPRRGAILRPLLGVSRATTEQACVAQGLEPWRDPHNADPAFTRVRVRERVLPVLERELGPGVSEALARTAELAREDADALDALAESLADGMIDVETIDVETIDVGMIDAETHAGPEPGGAVRLSIPVGGLAEQPPALRNRVIRLAAERLCGAHLSREHTLAVASLVAGWRGQGPVFVPGLRVSRSDGRLVFERQIGSPRRGG